MMQMAALIDGTNDVETRFISDPDEMVAFADERANEPQWENIRPLIVKVFKVEPDGIPDRMIWMKRYQPAHLTFADFCRPARLRSRAAITGDAFASSAAMVSA